MAQYPSTSASQKLLVTKSNTAGQKNISTNAYDTVSPAPGGGGFGSWVQVVASLGSDYAITMVATKITSAEFVVGDFPLVLQVGNGGAGSETSLVDIPIPMTSTAVANFNVVTLPVAVRIASGQRVAVRAYSATTAGGVTILTQVFGVPYANIEGN